MHTNIEFNLLAFQVMKGSPIVSDSPPRSQILHCYENRSSSPHDNQIKFEVPWVDVRGTKTMGLSSVFYQSVFFLINLFSLQEISKEKVTKGHQKVFQDDWLDNPQFKPWSKTKKINFDAMSVRGCWSSQRLDSLLWQTMRKGRNRLTVCRRGIVSSKTPKWKTHYWGWWTKFCKQCESYWTTNIGRMYRWLC